MSSVHVIAGIAWDPQIRGFLALLVGVVVLLGSVYLLLLTNLGSRLGFLVGAAAFWGWLFLMGSIWWLYGTVGMLGTLPHWEVKEVLYPGTAASDYADVRQLDTSGLPDPEQLIDEETDDLEAARARYEPDLDGWELLPESNPAYGEAKAIVDEHFVAEPDEELGIDKADKYVALYSFERGGKDDLDADPSRLDRIFHKLKSTFWEVRNPPRYAIIQIQRVVDQTAEPGKPPPIARADESTPPVTVVLERNLGSRRLPGAMLAISSGTMFAIFCATLHRRDKQAMEIRGMLPAGGEA